MTATAQGAYRRLFGEALIRHGNTPALVSRTETIHYDELFARASAVADALLSIGVLPGESVALVSSGRASDEPVGLTGILLFGAVVVPLDASAPAQRHFSVLSARNVRAIVVDEGAHRIRSGIDEEARSQGRPPFSYICLDGLGCIKTTTRAENPIPVLPETLDTSLACILHTSGSMGKPKPVPITWEGIFTFTDWMIELLSLSARDRVLRVAELVFDLAWFDHIASFRVGAALCAMSRRDLMSGRSLKEALAALRPSVVYGVPSLFMKLSAALAADEMLSPSPAAICFAGEVFPPRELFSFSSHLAAETRLFNLYGPTETNVCTFYEVRRDTLNGEAETPIGIACPYAHCEIVDETESRNAVEGPGTGELVVSGKTTLGGGPYRTGDRVERRSDGLLYFRGRIDRMVKIRGYRVEPLEVESTLDAHPAVVQSAVLPGDDPRLGRTLRAFVALRPDQSQSEEQMTERTLKIFLAERLPPYMVPERITILSELPRTTTGKVDYRALSVI